MQIHDLTLLERCPTKITFLIQSWKTNEYGEKPGGNNGEKGCLPLTCQILTIFSMAEARYLPFRLQASEAKQCSPGEPREFNPSSEELSLTQQAQRGEDTHKSKTFTSHG
jgi:hypothetical protein